MPPPNYSQREPAVHQHMTRRGRRRWQGCIRREGASEAAPAAVRQAVGGGYSRLQLPLKPARGLRETVEHPDAGPREARPAVSLSFVRPCRSPCAGGGAAHPPAPALSPSRPQTLFQAIDIELHHRYDPDDAAGPSPFDVYQKLAVNYSVTPPLPEDRFLCSFGHIFAGGYSAGYYSYKWAEVMSADAFAAFEEAGLDDEEAVRAVGRRFRDTVLALGGGKHPAEVYREFRGRDPSPEALLRHSGLA